MGKNATGGSAHSSHAVLQKPLLSKGLLSFAPVASGAGIYLLQLQVTFLQRAQGKACSSEEIQRLKRPKWPGAGWFQLCLPVARAAVGWASSIRGGVARSRTVWTLSSTCKAVPKFSNSTALLFPQSELVHNQTNQKHFSRWGGNFCCILKQDPPPGRLVWCYTRSGVHQGPDAMSGGICI